MKTRIYCPDCDDMCEFSIQNCDVSFLVRGEEINVKANLPVCVVCGREIVDEEYGSKALDAAYTEYCRRNDILTPSEVQSLRNHLGLSKRALARFLGWGLVTVQRYEDGAIPDKSHSEVLKSLRNPYELRRLLDSRGHLLTEPQRKYLQESLNSLESDYLVSAVVGSTHPSIENGFRPFDFDRFSQMIIFFAMQGRLWKTKLLKLLFYSDFVHFRNFSTSISGSPYLAYRMGPVPKDYGFLLDRLEREGVIALQLTPCGEFEGEIVQPLAEFDPTIFSQDELATLEMIAKELGSKSAKTLSDMSHTEKAWLETPQSSVIDYSHADSIQTLG